MSVTSPPPSSETPPLQQASPVLEETKNRDESETTQAVKKEKESVHKTKTIQFLGRTAPIILQNDNGPCPLLAICNVLLLKNSISLSPDVAEVSQEKLLSLVADRLIDSNSNINNKDAGYIENQQQNIADAIDLLPRLTTGIDVNIKFTRIDDFEFTRECAIFDLLDIPLYHGWIVDPQDQETADAIGLKSYNTLMGELVALEADHIERNKHDKESIEDDVVIDFAAATTAALGVPSPCLSRSSRSFDNSPVSVLCDDDNPMEARKGDQEENELSGTLELSLEEGDVPTSSNAEGTVVKDTTEPNSGLESSLSGSTELVVEKEEQSVPTPPEPSAEEVHSSTCERRDAEDKSDCNVDSDLSRGRKDIGETETISSSVDGSEPIYEGEECILKSETENYQNREPMYEGEAVLTEQAIGDSRDIQKPNVTLSEGKLIRNFLKTSASQLTIYGLFCLQEGLKEREICVFFRNNHFNTMFKYEGQLYILATDQGYLNQPDLVWEKLNEVNGDTVFVTGNFKDFKLESHEENAPWDEQSALASTADYIASIDKPVAGQSGFNSDLQLAIALQQQEFEQQQAPQQQQPTINAGSGLITGPQVSRYSAQQVSSSSSSKQETPKSSSSSKDRCILM
ncbi:hypothetical protein DM860_001783 [Cuscuta australis]|uniref:MINDY deubiquitinase domain-containing protein n=1 Tax=Cuscuta australis TaxID=267555 RepID=A0A328E9B9_9ASTE|nr:hypothetical protein DM860_001783 [Cuscuta australis]